MNHLYRIILIALLLLLIIGILSTTMNTLSMGYGISSGQLEYNKFINYIFGFPVGIFKRGFPLLLSNDEFWSFTNIALMIINSLIQAAGLYFVFRQIKKLPK